MHFALRECISPSLSLLVDGEELLEVHRHIRSHGQPPALVEVEHVTLLLLPPLLVAVVHRDVPQVAGVVVVIVISRQMTI